MVSLSNEERISFNFNKVVKRKFYTTSAIRRSGKR